MAYVIFYEISHNAHTYCVDFRQYSVVIGAGRPIRDNIMKKKSPFLLRKEAICGIIYWYLQIILSKEGYNQ